MVCAASTGLTYAAWCSRVPKRAAGPEDALPHRRAAGGRRRATVLHAARSDPPQQQQRRMTADEDRAGSQEVYRAADHSAPTTSTFGASLATLILGATLLAERLDGEGLIAKLDTPQDHPLLVAAVLGLAAAAVWPRAKPAPREDAVVGWRHLAGRVSYAALAGAIATEMATGQGALAALSVETGIEELGEAEAVLAFLLMLMLSTPRKAA